ncbi:helix-turn-helix domain-containing protein [Flavonifractor plautii]|jgi:transposase|uniref:helix-turn-helix domain-containing protein n=1 Tax=Flavonifractor plautii TaxID=292800 RepID=UPI0018A8F249|nr:helix-turn-helix domain-containing protein [Flavonifractor plautii]DAT98181.1 MAG TPA: helix-turn-helix domain protein [Caudoviricetes sp.]
MAARLTDRQKKKIVADYLETESYNATAKINGVSKDTVKRVVLGCEGFAQKAQQKKRQNTLDMLAFMETRKEKMQEAIDLHLMALTDPEKISDAGLSQIATSFGIIVDKATKNTASGNDSLNKLDGLLKEFRDAVKSETN